MTLYICNTILLLSTYKTCSFFIFTLWLLREDRMNLELGCHWDLRGGQQLSERVIRLRERYWGSQALRGQGGEKGGPQGGAAGRTQWGDLSSCQWEVPTAWAGNYHYLPSDCDFQLLVTSSCTIISMPLCQVYIFLLIMFYKSNRNRNTTRNGVEDVFEHKF